MEILAFKLVSFFLSWSISLFGLLPLLTRGWKQRDTYLSMANAFSGGVFLGAGFLHLFSEAVSVYQEEILGGEGKEDALPLPFILCPCGFLLTLYVEKIMCAAPEEPEEGNEMEQITYNSEGVGSPKEISREPAPMGRRSSSGAGGHSHAGSGGHGHSHGAELLTSQGGKNKMYPMILFFVLSIHSVVSGMALGVQTTVVKASVILVAIVSHKWVEAFALGVTLLKSGVSPPTLAKTVLSCGFMTPLGIMIGGSLQQFMNGSTGILFNFVLTAVASGTFLYVAIVDILLEEFNNRKHASFKFILCLIGMFSMLIVSLIFGDEHGHGHSGHSHTVSTAEAVHSVVHAAASEVGANVSHNLRAGAEAGHSHG